MQYGAIAPKTLHFRNQDSNLFKKSEEEAKLNNRKLYSLKQSKRLFLQKEKSFDTKGLKCCTYVVLKK